MKQFIDRWIKPCMFTYEVHSALPPPEFFRLWQCLCFLASSVYSPIQKQIQHSVFRQIQIQTACSVCSQIQSVCNLWPGAACSLDRDRDRSHSLRLNSPVDHAQVTWSPYGTGRSLSLASLSIVILLKMPSYWYWSINISCRYWAARNTCPKCSYRWTNDLSSQVPPSYQPRETFVTPNSLLPPIWWQSEGGFLSPLENGLKRL